MKVTIESYGQYKYGYILADVLLANGTTINYALVKDGRCWWYKEYASFDIEFGEARE